MNAKQAIQEQELAAYHFAEAERHERQAHNQRVTATKHLAASHLFFSDALKSAMIAMQDKIETSQTS
tara:strand:- start:930 stop:1130 length:201 start_codon:yes stop_codon:yes gene_type:complete